MLVSIVTLSTWFNGQFIDAADQQSLGLLTDRSNTFGDGVFETLFVRDGRAPLLALHLARLSRGLHCLDIDCRLSLIQQDIELALAAAKSRAGSFVLKLVVSRGSSLLGYGTQGQRANRMLLLQSYAVSPPLFLKTMLCETRLAQQPLLAGLKHCNRLEQVLAKREVELAGFDDGIMLDQIGDVVESTSANIFILEGGKLITPPIEQCGVAGVMREFIMHKLAPQIGVDVVEQSISLQRFYASDACGVSNAVQGLRPLLSCKNTDDKVTRWAEAYWADSHIMGQIQSAISNSVFAE